MVLQGSSGVGLRGAKMVSRGAKVEAPSPQMATPRSQKGPAAEGVALKIFRLHFSLKLVRSENEVPSQEIGAENAEKLM